MSLENKSQSLKPFYIRQALFNFGNSVISPYVPIYAVQLGATSTEMGWFRSLTNLLGNIFQVPSGVFSDKLGRYLPAILIGGILSAILWLPLLFITTSIQLITIVAFQTLATSIIAPSWSSLLGKVIPKSRRGMIASRINIAASIGSIGATLISGYIMTIIGGSLSNMYMIPIGIATLCVFYSSTAMINVREKAFSNSSEKSSLINWELFRSNVNFRTLCKVSFVHSFFMSISWPLFPITMVRVVKIDMIQIAYISTISSIIALFVRRLIGRITDYAGRRKLIILSRAGIFIYPTIYAFATNFYHLVIANLIVGIFGAISEIVLFAYQLDITSEGQRGASLSLYNTVSGVATFFGSLFGGYAPSILASLGLNDLVSIQLTYAISAIGRLGGGLLYLKIKEPVPYPSTIQKEIKRVVSEDIERTKEELEQIELKGERVDRELQEDFELLEGRIRKKDH